SVFDWRQRNTSFSSRKYQPLPTMPCSRGSLPVSIVACAEHVTAGRTVPSSAANPSTARRDRLGVSAPSMPRVSPTTSSKRTGFNGTDRPSRRRARDGATDVEQLIDLVPREVARLFGGDAERADRGIAAEQRDRNRALRAGGARALLD